MELISKERFLILSFRTSPVLTIVFCRFGRRHRPNFTDEFIPNDTGLPLLILFIDASIEYSLVLEPQEPEDFPDDNSIDKKVHTVHGIVVCQRLALLDKD